MNTALWLERTAARHPERPALYSGTEQRANYAEFALNTARIGARLQRTHQVRAGDHVAIFAANSLNYLQALYGIWYAGAVPVPINAKLHPREAEWIIEDAQARIGFIDAEHSLPDSMSIQTIALESASDFESGDLPLDAPLTRGEHDVAWLFYTSGTTGKPKGVMITHGNIQTMALSYLADVDTTEQSDAALYAAPISHGAGLYNVQHVLAGAKHVVPLSAGFDPAEVFALAREIQGVHLFAAPTMVKRLVQHSQQSGEQGEGIRTVVYGGGPMYLADIVTAVDQLGPRFVQIYGQGECPMCISSLSREQIIDRRHPRWRERLASVGVAQSVVELQVVDPAGSAVPCGDIGEIVVRGRGVMKGYWRNEKASAEALRDGWLWTGDMGSLDADGFLTLKDRSKDVIISGGSNIYPREVEEALLTHPTVDEVSVVGQVDLEWGEVVVAFVVGENICSTELDAHCLTRIARFKRPKRYVACEQLPKNNYGKVLKTELRQQLGDN